MLVVGRASLRIRICETLRVSLANLTEADTESLSMNLAGLIGRKRLSPRRADQRLSLVGNSHVICVARSTEPPLNCEVHGIQEEDLVTQADGTLVLHPSLKARLYEPLVSFVDESIQSILGHIQHPRPFDFIHPDAPDLPFIEGAEIIPYRCVADAVHLFAHRCLETIRLFREAVPGRMLHMEPLRPFREDTLPDSPLWQYVIGDITEVSPPYLRLKIWMIYSDVMRQFCERHGIVYVPNPPAAIDDEGFTRQEYLGPAAHGNVAFGALVRRQILDYL
jgi:hypothetical protein